MLRRGGYAGREYQEAKIVGKHAGSCLIPVTVQKKAGGREKKRRKCQRERMRRG